MHSSQKIAIGAFVLGGLVLFTLGLYWIGERRFLFSDNIELYAEFANVSGLKTGSRVAVSGMDGGEVLYIGVPASPGAKFRVKFRLLEKFRPILRLDSVATIQTDGLVGNKLLQVDPGTAQSRRAERGDTISSREPVEFNDVVRETVETVRYARSAVDEVRGRVDEAVDNLVGINQAATGLIQDVGTQVARITAATQNVVAGVDEIVEGVQQGRGSAGKLFTDDRLYEDVRGTVRELQQTSGNLVRITSDVNEIVGDIKRRQLGKNLEQTMQNIEEISVKGKQALGSLLPGSPGEEGLASSLRRTLVNTNEAMSDMAENAEALKRNWFFRGFFNARGFYDLDAISLADYRSGKFAPKLKPRRHWLAAGELFAKGPDAQEVLTEEGMHRLDLAMAEFLQESQNSPLMIEGYAAAGTSHEQFLLSRERAVRVRNYLIPRFSLRTNYVGFVPLGAEGSPDGQFKASDGVSLVLFTNPKATRK